MEGIIFLSAVVGMVTGVLVFKAGIIPSLVVGLIVGLIIAKVKG